MNARTKEKWMVAEKEVILLHIGGTPETFARVERIEPDVKEGWWQVDFLLLTIPPQNVSWVIAEPHMAGAQFSIGATPIRLEPVPSAPPEQPKVETRVEGEGSRPGAKVIPLFGRPGRTSR